MAVQDKTGFTSYLGSFIATAIGALTFEEWAVMVGILLGLATFAVNLHYKRKLANAQIKADQAKADYYSGGSGDDH